MNTHPEKWYIPLTEENYDEVKSWWLKQVEKNGWHTKGLPHDRLVISEHPWDLSQYWSSPTGFSIEFSDYQEITLEQFRQITNSTPKTMLNIIPKINQAAPVRIASTPSNIAGQIFYTTDYGIFKELLGNREVDYNHVRRLVKSMQEEYLEIPIQVNQKMQVIDGQHRLAACKELGLPIYYMICKGSGLDQTQRQNALSKKWTIMDVLESFCKRGFSNYILVKSFMQDFGFTLTQSLTILTLNQLSTEQMLGFKDGNFEIKNLNQSKIVAKNLLKLKDVVALNDTIIFRAFFHLVTKCEEFDVNYFIQKMEYQSQKFKKQRDRALQIENIEEIYNYRNQNKVNLRIIK